MKQSSRYTVLVTGAGGQLGKELGELSEKYTGYNFLLASRKDLPIEENEAVKEYFASNTIHYCVNCAAYTAVDKAETEKDQATRINGTSVGYLAQICKEHQVKLIHISTDYVYDGTRKEPLKENNPVAPLNAYGRSKLMGEELAMKNNSDSLIIRISWVYSSYGHNFLKTMMRLLVEKEEVNVVADQIGCPTYAADLAEVIMSFITQMSAGKKFSGIYNYSNYGITTWFQFAQFIKDKIGSNCSINPVPSSSYPTPAIRPLYSVLDTGKIRSDLKIEIPFWKDSVEKCIDKILSGNES